MLEELAETLEALLRGDTAAYADGLADSVWMTIGSAVEYGIPFPAVWDEVNRANMAKYPHCPDCYCYDARSGTNCLNCGTCNGLGRIVLRDAGGKVLKPEGWAPPDIARVLLDATQAAQFSEPQGTHIDVMAMQTEGAKSVESAIGPEDFGGTDDGSHYMSVGVKKLRTEIEDAKRSGDPWSAMTADLIEANLNKKPVDMNALAKDLCTATITMANEAAEKTLESLGELGIVPQRDTAAEAENIATTMLYKAAGIIFYNKADPRGVGWYFYDETWADSQGPYETEQIANVAVKAYCNNELHCPQPEVGQVWCYDETKGLKPVFSAMVVAVQHHDSGQTSVTMGNGHGFLTNASEALVDPWPPPLGELVSGPGAPWRYMETPAKMAGDQ